MNIELSENIMRKLRAFRKVVDVVIGEQLESESAYVELVLYIGLERMLLDVLPNEETLQKTMIAMFRENPEFVSDFVARMLKRGEIIRSEEARAIEKKWRHYIV